MFSRAAVVARPWRTFLWLGGQGFLPGAARSMGGSSRALARAARSLPGDATSCNTPPGAPTTSQELPGAVTSYQEFPGAARSSKELSGALRSCQELSGALRSKEYFGFVWEIQSSGLRNSIFSCKNLIFNQSSPKGIPFSF